MASGSRIYSSNPRKVDPPNPLPDDSVLHTTTSSMRLFAGPQFWVVFIYFGLQFLSHDHVHSHTAHGKLQASMMLNKTFAWFGYMMLPFPCCCCCFWWWWHTFSGTGALQTVLVPALVHGGTFSVTVAAPKRQSLTTIVGTNVVVIGLNAKLCCDGARVFSDPV